MLQSTGCFHAGQDLVLPPLHAAPAPVSPLHAPRPVFVLAVLGGKGPSGAEERPRRLGHALMPPYVAAPPPPTEAYERHSVRVQFMETAWKERVAPKAWLMLEVRRCAGACRGSLARSLPPAGVLLLPGFATRLQG